jgi:hypothetical protein
MRLGGRQGRSQKGCSSLAVLVALVFATTGTLLGGCGTSSASQQTATALPPLTKSVSYGGVTMRVPTRFQVRPFNDCISWADNIVQIGPPASMNGACVRRPQTGTGVNFSTVATVSANADNWPIRRTVNGLSIMESRPVDVRCTAGCAHQALLFVKVPAYGVGILFRANGTVNSGALHLSQMMISTLSYAPAGS